MYTREKELLINLRSKLVGEKHTLPYTIYTDDTIEELLKVRPKSIEELSKVKGFPAKGKRVKGFGEAVVAIFTSEIKDFKLEIKDGKPEVTTVLKKMKVF